MIKKKSITSIFIALFLLITTIGNISAQAMMFIPDKLIISAGNRIIGTMYYDDFYIQVNKISSKLGVGYCLEVEKDYPHGETYALAHDDVGIYDKVLSCGYPIHSADELGLDTDEDAYFATQVAIWAFYEKYDIDKINISDAKVLQAIKNIYNKAKLVKSDIPLENTQVYYCNDTLQRVVIAVDTSVDVIPEPPENQEGPDVPPVIPKIPENQEEPSALEEEVDEYIEEMGK